ncbi:MAG: T9SS type A sorting domain-containing protein [Bacteroidia bacterium]|nr:T9SS type A sorting domain-containing protein [Bacteroidia bacterium]
MPTPKSLILWIILLISLKSSILYAQWGVINTAKLIPEQPTDNDSIHLIVQSVFPSSGCNLAAKTIQLNMNEFRLQAFHLLGPLTVICTSEDTFSLGKLPSGQYTLIYDLLDSLTLDRWASDTIIFAVQQSTQRPQNLSWDNTVSVFPNPTSDKLFFQVENDVTNYSVAIYNYFGQFIRYIPLVQGKSYLEIGDLPAGIYFIAFNNDTTKALYIPVEIYH